MAENRAGARGQRRNEMQGGTLLGDTGYSFEIQPPAIPENEIVETVSADLVIVGAGLAGLTAAKRATELGASVAVLEKTATISIRGGQICSVNSAAWRAAGAVNDKKEFAREWICACGNRCREDQVWLFVNHSEEAMDWLIAMQARYGIRAKLVGTRYAGSVYTERYGAHMFVIAEGKNVLLEVGEHLHEESAAAGARYFFETPGLYLEKKDDRVTAVIAGKPGAYRRFSATHGVLLATGDIAADEEMLRAYCPIFLKVKHNYYWPKGANTGDGHKMGLWAGGVMEDGPFPAIMHPQAYSRLVGFFLFVNARGERFMNEDTWGQAKSLNVLKQPEGVDYAYSVFDSDYIEQLIAGMPYSGGLFNDNAGATYGVPFTGALERRMMQTGLANGNIVTADTLEELARKMGVDTQTFLATAARYNALVEAKDDVDYGKRPELLFPLRKPPFYASKFGPSRLAVTGGLLVDRRLQVLDRAHNPIPGLYAIGNVAGGLYGVDYPTLIPGSSHGRAVTWGYLAARSALQDREAPDPPEFSCKAD